MPGKEPEKANTGDSKAKFDRFVAISQVIANLAVATTLAFTGMQLLDARRASYQQARLQSWLDLFHTFDDINNYIATNTHKAPLYPEFRSDPHTATLLFHHINLAYRAWSYHQIGTVNDEEFKGFENWTDKVLFTWLERESCVAADMNTILTFGDTYPEGFLKWFKGLPGYARALRQASQCQTLPQSPQVSPPKTQSQSAH